jgi:hypothetical protein
MAQKPIGYYGEFRPTGVDTSAARRFEALAGLANQANDIAFNIAAKKRAEQGEKAGMAAGIKAAEDGTRIEKEKGFLSSISIYDQAKNKAVEASYVSSIATDARENIARLAEESNGDPKVFNTRSTEYLKGLRGGISEDFQDIVQLAIDPVVAAGRAQIQSEYSARQDQEVNDALILEAQSALDFSIRQADLGDQESATGSLFLAHESIQARVASGDLTQAAADTLKTNATVAVESSMAMGALKNTYQERGGIAAVELIEKISDPNFVAKGFTVEQQGTLVDTMKQELNQRIQLDKIQESEEEESLKVRQESNATGLLLGLIGGEITSSQISVAAAQRNISYDQLTTLTSIANTRGQGVDDYGIIREVQKLMVNDPAAAQRLIELNVNKNITGSTAQGLLQSAIDAQSQESVLNTNKAKRARTYVQRSISTTGIFGSIDPENQFKLANLELTLDQRILAGEDPLEVALEIIDFSGITSKSLSELEADIVAIEARMTEELAKNLDYDYSSDDAEITKINQQINEKRNYEDFNKNVIKTLKGSE